MPRTAAAAVIAAALACGGDPPPQQAGGATYRLAPVGDGEIVLHPGESRTVQVILAEDGRGGVANALVKLEIQGDPGTLTLAPAAATTGSDGVATVRLTAGPRTASVGVIARAPAFDVPEVTLSVDIVPVRKMLRVVAGAGTVPDEGGRTASVFVSASGSTPLRVREVDADTGEPIAGDAILFAVAPTAGAAFAAGGRSARAVTNAAGEAQVFLFAGAVEPIFEASAFPASSDADAVYFAVTVVGDRAPVCQVECPVAWQCVDGICEPPPTPPPAPAAPDVTGVWYTRHVFSIRHALPGTLQFAFGAIRAFDQFLSGRLGLPGWLQAVIGSVLQEFIPGWFYALVRLADDLGTLLSFLRAEGKMRISPGTDAAHPSATETWTSLVFYWLPLCGEEIDGDPEVPPECARLDVATSDSRDAPFSPRCRGEVLPTVAVHAAPFSAAVAAVPGTDPPRWELQVPDRQVDVEIGRAMVTAIDAALSLATPWQCIAEATDCRAGQQCIADCAGLGAWVSDFTSGVVPGGAIESACTAAVAFAGQTVVDLLASAKFESDLLAFGGRASIGGVGDDDSICRGGARCAGQLGNDSFDADLRYRPASRDGAWSGAFFASSPGDVPGAWEGKRSPFR